MSAPDPLRSSASGAPARDAVVRSLARAAERACSRPGCPAPARATLAFRYQTREVWIERLAEQSEPETYDLCEAHASRTRPPHGWELRDRRPREEQVAEAAEPSEATAEDLGSDRTVAVLAEALGRGGAADSSSTRAEGDDGPGDVDRPEEDVGPADDPRPEHAETSEDDDGPERPGGLEDSASPVLEPPRGTGPVGPPDGVPAEAEPRPVPAARARRGGERRGDAARDW